MSLNVNDGHLQGIGIQYASTTQAPIIQRSALEVNYVKRKVLSKPRTLSLAETKRDPQTTHRQISDVAVGCGGLEFILFITVSPNIALNRDLYQGIDNGITLPFVS